MRPNGLTNVHNGTAVKLSTPIVSNGTLRATDSTPMVVLEVCDIQQGGWGTMLRLKFQVP